MAKTIHLTYYGMDGAGATVREAKEAAGRKLTAAMDGFYTPAEAMVHGIRVLVWRAPGGWSYRLPESFGSGFYDSQAEALGRGCNHAAQNAWTIDVPDDGGFVAAVPNLTEPARRDLVSYFAWQRSYRALRGSGLSDAEAHAKARA